VKQELSPIDQCKQSLHEAESSLKEATRDRDPQRILQAKRELARWRMQLYNLETELNG